MSCKMEIHKIQKRDGRIVPFESEKIVAAINKANNEVNEWEWPQCHNKDHDKMNVTRRTCGYLGENFWNAGAGFTICKRMHSSLQGML